MNSLTPLDIKCLNNIPLLMETINASTRNLRYVLLECGNRIDQEIRNELLSKKWMIEDKQKWVIGPKSANIYWRWKIIRSKKNICEVFCEYDSAAVQPIFFQLIEGEHTSILVDEFKKSIDVDSPFIKVCNGDSDDNYVSIELEITPDLSEKQINGCAEEFINKVLRPYLELLTSTFGN